jgi:hypothetical protein
MSKVTNNENMRRYVHMALSKIGNGGSGSGSGGSCECPAPLVIKGGIQNDGGDYSFIPDDNQPTFSEAVSAFNSGVQIIFDVNPNPGQTMPDGVYFRSTPLECVSDYEGYKCFMFFNGGSPVYWNDPGDGGNQPLS